MSSSPKLMRAYLDLLNENERDMNNRLRKQLLGIERLSKEVLIQITDIPENLEKLLKIKKNLITRSSQLKNIFIHYEAILSILTEDPNIMTRFEPNPHEDNNLLIAFLNKGLELIKLHEEYFVLGIGAEQRYMDQFIYEVAHIEKLEELLETIANAARQIITNMNP